jgi:parallel beta-helix repeat protein
MNNQRNIVVEGKTYRNTILKIKSSDQIRFNKCTFEDASLYFIECSNITVSNCTFKHTNSKHSLQCDKSNHIRIEKNYFEEPVGRSQAVDIISMYKSNNAVIDRNYLIGGGPNRSGGGIMLGDNMGDNQVASNNICVNCGQYGIAIAGGNNNKIINNTVMGLRNPWTNVGIYVWGIPQRNSVVNHATVSNNRVSWKNKDGRDNPMWISSQNTNHVVQSNNQLNVRYSVPERPVYN